MKAKRLLSILFACALVLGMMSIGVSASETVLQNGVTEESFAVMAAKAGDVEYATLADAIAAAEAGQTVTLLADCALNEKVEISKDLTLDLNGKEITTSGIVGSRVFVLNSGCTAFTLNANDGKITSADANAYGIIDVNTSADVTVNGGTYDFDTNNGGLFKFRSYESTITLNDVTAMTNAQVSGPSYSGNTLDVNGGTFKSETTYNGHNYFQFYIANGAAATFDDVTVDNDYVGCLENAGGNVTMNNCNVTVEGTHSASYLSVAVSVSGGGNLTVNSGNYTAKPMAESDANGCGNTHGSWCVAIMGSGGTLTINGGSFANGYAGDAVPSNPRGVITVGADAYYGDDVAANLVINGGDFNSIGNVVDCETIWGSETNSSYTYMPTMSIGITGGTFDYNGKAVGGCDPISTSNPVEVSISGGTFEVTDNYVSEYVAYGNSFSTTTGEVAESASSAWSTATDAGSYVDGGTTYGMMRFLFAADVEGVTSSGIMYIKGNDPTKQVGDRVIGTSNAFYGDIVGIEEGTEGSYYAVAYITTAEGTVWSDPLRCTIDWTKQFTNYGGAQ